MDWIAVQLLLTLLMIVCYLYADRRRLLASGLTPILSRAEQVRGAIVSSLEQIRARVGQLQLSGEQASQPRLDLHARAADGSAPAADWLQSLNALPDRYPHILIIGPTGSGKTTFTMALLASRPGRIAVLTPKPDPDDWPGVPIVTIDDDGGFSDLTRAFVALDREIKQRLVATKNRHSPGEPLTIICDDWPVLSSECGRPASDLFKLVGRLGRSLRVRLIVLSQSKQVKSLGLDGEGDALSNFARVTLTTSHSATIHLEAGSLVLDTRLVPQLAALPSVPGRWWQRSIPNTRVPEGRILADLLIPAPDTRSGTEVVPGHQDAVPPGSHDRVLDTSPVPADTDPEADKIRDLAAQGWNRSQIASEIGGRRATALERIARVLGEAK